jgi:transposase
VTEALPEAAQGKPLEIWFQDEARVGQQGTLTRVWARRGTRPRGVRDTRYEWSYLFGAVCPDRAATAALVLPFVNTEAMALHLAEIARNVTPGAHAVLVLDGAGWHGSRDLVVPDNITLLKLPPYAPELNPVENVWQYLRANKLAITVFDSYSDVVEKCCAAWNFFAESPQIITSITSRDWATVSN